MKAVLPKLKREYQDSHQLLVKKLLENPVYIDDAVWERTGLGMLKCYLSPDTRLTIWDSMFEVPGASRIHDHPWSFSSRIIAGKLTNIRYAESSSSGALYYRQRIATGVGTLLKERFMVNLAFVVQRDYSPGSEYFQSDWEIHETVPENGTVTLLTKHGVNMPSQANVYYPVDQEFGSAGSKRATLDEVMSTCRMALEKWF